MRLFEVPSHRGPAGRAGTSQRGKQRPASRVTPLVEGLRLARITGQDAPSAFEARRTSRDFTQRIMPKSNGLGHAVLLSRVGRPPASAEGRAGRGGSLTGSPSPRGRAAFRNAPNCRNLREPPFGVEPTSCFCTYVPYYAGVFRPCSARSFCKSASDLACEEPSMAFSAISWTFW